MVKKIGSSYFAVAISIGIAPPQERSGKGLLQPGMKRAAAGVDQEAARRKQTTRDRRNIELSSYLQLGKHGEKHASCGKKCIANGQRSAL
jgi:hypothetical protein